MRESTLIEWCNGLEGLECAAVEIMMMMCVIVIDVTAAFSSANVTESIHGRELVCWLRGQACKSSRCTLEMLNMQRYSMWTFLMFQKEWEAHERNNNCRCLGVDNLKSLELLITMTSKAWIHETSSSIAEIGYQRFFWLFRHSFFFMLALALLL